MAGPRSGVLVNVPQPVRYAIHKLIVATRRIPSAAAKARKDIEQAAALIRVLAKDRLDGLGKVLWKHRIADRHGESTSTKVCGACF